MSGRWLLDAAALLGASRRILSQHVALRNNQFDDYKKTSSLARAIKYQTDRVTLTAKAASALAQRFGERDSKYSAVPKEPVSKGKAAVPSEQSVDNDRESKPFRQGLEQDHFYNRSEANTTNQPVSSSALSVRQEQAKATSLPDGSIATGALSQTSSNRRNDVSSKPSRTAPAKQPLSADSESQALRPEASQRSTIPDPTHSTTRPTADEARRLQRQAEAQIQSQTADPPPSASSAPDQIVDGEPELGIDQEREVYYTPPSSSSPVLSSLHRVKVPKNTKDIQASDEHVSDDGINQDVYYSSSPDGKSQPVPQIQAQPEQKPILDEMYSEIFHSPRVAKLLSGKQNDHEGSKGLYLLGPKSVPRRETKASSQMDAETFNSRSAPIERSEQDFDGSLQSASSTEVESSKIDAHEPASDIIENAKTDFPAGDKEDINSAPAKEPFQMRESRVPSSRFGRLWQYGGLATSMAFGAVNERFRRAAGVTGGSSGSLLLSESNVERLVAKLSRMRGAALKLGQMMSFQDSKMLPAPIHEVLQRVQDSADYMPASQRNKVLASNLGSEWWGLFSSFDEIPMAAASIGQVHGAVLKSTGQRVAVKVQYPGVADSIDSDLSNLAILLTASRLLPKGLYLDKTIANARTELAWECDYVREAEAAKRFQSLLQDEKDTFLVPAIIDEASGAQVLTMERMEGVGVTKVQNFSQDDKDWIGTQILRLCLREITEFKYMQTDPNWTNFLYNADSRKLELLDFGASREYPEKFIVPYIRILLAASKNDRDSCRDLSIQLGYLTGHESRTMLNAHIESVLTLAEPFRDTSPEVYDFCDQTITERVKALIPVMIKERLAPPPEETYSLHRKLSGAFLLCARLGSRVRCKEMFAKAMEKAMLQ